MRSGRPAALAAGLLLAAGSAIAQADGDSLSPESFDQRLAFVEAQTASSEGACKPRLDAAKIQRNSVAASPAYEVVLPGGGARLADIDYRLHLAYGFCGEAGEPRKFELLAAQEAAERAVSLYRDTHDYQSMAVMQYDLAATDRLLGDQDKAVTDLQAALAMDRDHGFAADAEENAALLAKWQVPVDAGVPRRSITLTFRGMTGDADATVSADYVHFIGEDAIHGHASTDLVSHMRPDSGHWVLSADQGERRYEFREWRNIGKPELAQAVLIRAVQALWMPAVQLGATGAFQGLIDVDKTSDAALADLDRLVEGEESAGVSVSSAREVLEAGATEDFVLSSSAWTDMKMDQGVWYEMTAPLILPGQSLVLTHDIQFTYARSVACREGAKDDGCAEILVHAVIDADKLNDLQNGMRVKLRLTGRHGFHYAGAIDVRLVIEPDTMRLHESEIRRHWYVAVDGRGDPLIASEKVVSTYTWR